MKVCICHNVSDREIRKLVRQGYTDPALVMQRSQAGTCCRQCIPEINRLVESAAELDEIKTSIFQPIVYSPT